MSIKTLGPGGINNNFAVVMHTPTSTGSLYGYIPPVAAGATGVFNDREDLYKGSLNLGAGVAVGSTAVNLYNEEVAGSGMIKDLLLINKGNVTFYFNTNTETATVNTATPVGSGESVMLENRQIRSVWAITASSSTLVAAHGDYHYNRHTV